MRLGGPGHEAEHEQHGDRVVEPRLPLECAGEPPPERRAAEHGEHCGAVGRGENGAEQETVDEVQTEQPGRGETGEECSDDRADEGEAHGLAEHRADLAPAGGDPSLEQDQRQGDDPDRAGEPVVAEGDPPEAVGADRHPEAEHQDETGDAEAPASIETAIPAVSSPPAASN